MTVQNIIFLASIAAIGLLGLFHLNFIFNHLLLMSGVAAAAVAALYYVTSQGMIDWDEWIPRPRD